MSEESAIFASSSPNPELDSIVTTETQLGNISLSELQHRDSLDEGHQIGDGTPIERELGDNEGTEHYLINETKEVDRPNEPSWLADFDPELIDSLRGVVNFID